METASKGRRPPAHGDSIEPMVYRPHARRYFGSPGRAIRWAAAAALVLCAAVLIYGVWFVWTARQVVLTVTPQPSQMTIQGAWMAPRFGDYHLLRPGRYVLEARCPCYRDLSAPLQVGPEARQIRAFEMRPAPGRLSLTAHPEGRPEEPIDNARVLLDGEEIGRTPLVDREVPPGAAQLLVQADGHLPVTRQIQVEGCRRRQKLTVALVPGWAPVFVDAAPAGAAIEIDGRTVGAAPADLKVPVGRHRIRITAAGRKPWESHITVEPGQPLNLGRIDLQPAAGRLHIISKPAGAQVLAAGGYAGQTPATAVLPPDREHEIRLSKAGFAVDRRMVSVGSGAEKTLRIELEPLQGTVAFDVRPADAALWIDGQSVGSVPDRLPLKASSHDIEIRKEGYRSFRVRITPLPGLVHRIAADLTPAAAPAARPPDKTAAANGYPLKRIVPKAFRMGASRREQGRRPNETLRQINLQRPFWMGMREVSNLEFKAFDPRHRSGTFQGRDLDAGGLPVVSVSWRSAALFCNWLSEQDGLPAFYAEKEDRMRPAEPLNTGYRLPTEAEWEYCARFDGQQAVRKYVWGEGFPPPDQSGNFADAAARGLLNSVLSGYQDGYSAAAPTARFPPNPLGLFDLGGNAAEWCHDAYTIHPYEPDAVYTDPVGPENGSLHVIRGASWQDAAMTVLRTAYRGYGDKGRDNVGFRICRYAE